MGDGDCGGDGVFGVWVCVVCVVYVCDGGWVRVGGGGGGSGVFARRCCGVGVCMIVYLVCVVYVCVCGKCVLYGCWDVGGVEWERCVRCVLLIRVRRCGEYRGVR